MSLIIRRSSFVISAEPFDERPQMRYMLVFDLVKRALDPAADFIEVAAVLVVSRIRPGLIALHLREAALDGQEGLERGAAVLAQMIGKALDLIGIANDFTGHAVAPSFVEVFLQP